MNANELADEAEMWGEDLLALNMKGGIPVIECARMLRQQQAEIEALKKDGAFWKNQYEQMCRDYQYYKGLHDKEVKRLADEEKASQERAKYGIY